MSRSGNQNIKGSVRVEIIGGNAAQFVAGTNSGIFATVVRTGVGTYQATLLAANPISLNGSGVVQPQLEGTVLGIITHQIASGTLIEVRTFDNAGPPAPADLPFSLRIRERFVG